MQNGTYTVIPTFFTNENEVDLKMLMLHLDHLRNIGFNKFVFLGTTSETPTLSTNEKVNLVNFILSNKKEEDFFIFGMGGNDPVKVIEQINQLNYNDNRVDAIMLSSPSYNKPNQDGLVAYFGKIMNSFLDKNFLLYNVPSRTGVNVEPYAFKILENKHKNFIGIKEASGNIKQFADLTTILDRVKVFSGDDKLALPGYSIGTSGVISVASNLTNLVNNVWNYFKEGNIVKAIELNKRLNKLYDLLFIDTNPVPLKYLLSKNFGIESIYNVRLPLVKLNDSTEKILDHLNLNNNQAEKK